MLLLIPLLVAPKRGVFTSSLGTHAPSKKPAAFPWPHNGILNDGQEQTLIEMGHLRPSALASTLEYNTGTRTNLCGHTLWQRLHGLFRTMWHAQNIVETWRWWVLRDGVVGLPSVDRTAFIPHSAWGEAPFPERHTGVPVLLLESETPTAHARLAVAGRVAEDFALACAHGFPTASASTPLWLT